MLLTFFALYEAPGSSSRQEYYFYHQISTRLQGWEISPFWVLACCLLCTKNIKLNTVFCQGFFGGKLAYGVKGQMQRAMPPGMLVQFVGERMRGLVWWLCYLMKGVKEQAPFHQRKGDVFHNNLINDLFFAIESWSARGKAIRALKRKH